MPKDKSQAEAGTTAEADPVDPASMTAEVEAADATGSQSDPAADAGPRDPGRARAAAKAPAPAERSALDVELDEARVAVFAAITDWLSAAWEQPILRSLTADAGRALAHADAFPALRAVLRDLQANARLTVEDAIGPLLDPEVQLRDQALIASIDAAALQLVGLIGPPLKEAGFDPLGGGLERTQDGFRLKAMSEHEQVSAALRTYSAVKASLAVERAEQIERDREHARLEVERLWLATADPVDPV
jgi:hypothetical protein